jgi:acetylornithine/N-succinyldiaminopimelate aminotransferase
LCTEEVASLFGPGDLGTTFGGGPVAAAAIVAVIETIENEDLLANVRARETQIRDLCITGPVNKIQGRGLVLGLVCDRPALDVRNALLEQDILTGTSADPNVLRILAPLILTEEHVARLAKTLENLFA